MASRDDQIQGVRDALECGGGLVSYKSTAEAEAIDVYARIAKNVEVFDAQGNSRIGTTLRAVKSDLPGLGKLSTFLDAETTYKYVDVVRDDNISIQLIVRIVAES